MDGWCWVLIDASGSAMRTTDEFPSKEAAEEWMGDEWKSLLDEGADKVRLQGEGKDHYTMGLGSE